MKCHHCNFEFAGTEEFCANCGIALVPAENPREISNHPVLPLGTILNGKYHIEDILKGNSVNVYRATSEGEQNSLLIEEASVNNKKKLNIITRVIRTLGYIKPWLSAEKKQKEKSLKSLSTAFCHYEKNLNCFPP